MKELFTDPSIEVILLEYSDIVTTSGCGFGEDETAAAPACSYQS